MSQATTDLLQPVSQPESNPPTADPRSPQPGSSKELISLALPLVISQSFMTVQVLADTLLLAKHNTDEMTASFPAVMWYWLGFGFLSVTAGYTSTFVAQYTGAKRPRRVGPAVWQGLYFSLFAGLLFLLVVPAAPWLISLAGHEPQLQPLETTYLRCLAFAALPMLVMGAVNGFFSGRGHTWTVLGIEACGTGVNVGLALLLIFGRGGFPEMGIAGAGWATVIGSWASALLALALFFRRKYRDEFATLCGWRFERDRLGRAALGATTLTVRFNMVAFLPMMGIGQAVSILVGQRLGADQPDLAERSAYTGIKWNFGYMCVVAAAYLLIPSTLV